MGINGTFAGLFAAVLMLVLLLGATYFVVSNFELFQPASNKQLERELEKAGVKAPDNSKKND